MKINKQIFRTIKSTQLSEDKEKSFTFEIRKKVSLVQDLIFLNTLGILGLYLLRKCMLRLVQACQILLQEKL